MSSTEAPDTEADFIFYVSVYILFFLGKASCT